MADKAFAKPPNDLIEQLREQLDRGAAPLRSTTDVDAAPVAMDIVARNNGVLAGLGWLEAALRACDSAAGVDALLDEGARLTADTPVARMTGTPAAFEQTLPLGLAYLQTGSAAAGQALDYVKRVQGTGVRIRATGTALPGIDALARYALAIGSAEWPDASERITTPIDYAALGDVAAAVENARQGDDKTHPVLAAVETLETLDAALEANVDGVVLTDMASHMLTRAVNMADAHRRRFRSRLVIEATGMVTLGNVREMADTGLDAIRVPDLTLGLVGPAFRAVSVQPAV